MMSVPMNSRIGAYNTRVAPILLFMGTDIISIYIFIQFMRGIPKELDEAAFLDGANHWRIYRSVIFPLLKPAIATVIIIVVIPTLIIFLLLQRQIYNGLTQGAVK